MGVKLRYQLNMDEINRICIENGWGIGELSEITGISRMQLWYMSLPPDHPRFSAVGESSRKKLRSAFPGIKPSTLFLPLNLQSCKCSLERDVPAG